MRAHALAVALLLLVATGALAVTTSNTSGADVPGPASAGGLSGRGGGENMATATIIPVLPYSDSGTTVGHIDDYDAVCPYPGSTAPDVVYKLVATTDLLITVDLCASQYDTKVYIFEDVVNNVVACNDDGCGYGGLQSVLNCIEFEGGHTYYIVVDGYGTSAGPYAMTVVEIMGPHIECPPGAMISPEPDCYDGYVDATNGGCNSSPHVFEVLPPAAPGSSITVCGTSGTYHYAGYSYRDTDWFQLDVTETQTITTSCIAQFPLELLFIYVADCGDPQYLYVTGGIGEEVSLTCTCSTTAWIWVGPSVFSGIPCDGEYVLTIGGYETPSPVEDRSWGTVKAMYR